ncbi:TonB family protein [Hydrogenimonas sp.]
MLNRRKLFSLLLSLLIHLLLFSLFFLFAQRAEKETTSSGAKRVELSLSDFVTPPPSKPQKAPVPSSRPTPENRPLPPSPKPQPKTEKAPWPEPVEKPTPKRKEPTLKPKPKPKPKPLIAKKPAPSSPSRPKPLPKPIPEKPESAESALAGALGAPAMPQAQNLPKPPSIEQIDNTMSDREFHALYKDEFDHFTPNQKRFIKNNLNRIQAITQHYLTIRGYPPFAAQQRMQGINVVEFHLHPNGDITDLKVIASSGFDILDDNSLDTIRTAYKDYPRPKETTKIRFYIHYRIY